MDGLMGLNVCHGMLPLFSRPLIHSHKAVLPMYISRVHTEDSFLLTDPCFFLPAQLIPAMPIIPTHTIDYYSTIFSRTLEVHISVPGTPVVVFPVRRCKWAVGLGVWPGGYVRLRLGLGLAGGG